MREFKRVSLDGKGSDILVDHKTSFHSYEEPSRYTRPESKFASERAESSEWAWYGNDPKEMPISGAKPVPANAWKGSDRMTRSRTRTDPDENMWMSEQRLTRPHDPYTLSRQDMQSQNRQFTLMSNIMKVKHDTAKASINNVR